MIWNFITLIYKEDMSRLRHVQLWNFDIITRVIGIFCTLHRILCPFLSKKQNPNQVRRKISIYEDEDSSANLDRKILKMRTQHILLIDQVITDSRGYRLVSLYNKQMTFLSGFTSRVMPSFLSIVRSGNCDRFAIDWARVWNSKDFDTCPRGKSAAR